AEAGVAGRWRILVDTMLPDHCDDVDVPIARSYAFPVASTAPALVLVGALDPLATPDDVSRYLSGMPNAQVGTLPNSVYGGLQGWPACINDLRAAFLADPLADLQLDECTSQHSPPPIVVNDG
ncbi:MAG: hypothetical protein ACR2HQ_12985, partial [Ilumatobacteraceae bacterium]